LAGGNPVNEILELSLKNAREHRDDMARWLAVEVLLNDPGALADPILEDRLYALQDRIEQKLRAAADREQPMLRCGLSQPSTARTG
jgi:hypothetical protein